MELILLIVCRSVHRGGDTGQQRTQSGRRPQTVLLQTSSTQTSFLMGFNAFRHFRSNPDFFHGCWRPRPLVSCNNATRWHTICSGSFPPSYVSLVTSLILTSLTLPPLLPVLMLTFLLTYLFLLQYWRHSLPHPLPALCSNADVPPLLPFPVTILTSLTSPSSSCSLFYCWRPSSPPLSCYNADVTYGRLYPLLSFQL